MIIPNIGNNNNILQNYLNEIFLVQSENFVDSKFNSVAKIANILAKIDQTKLYDYPQNNDRPINKFLNSVFNVYIIQKIDIKIDEIKLILESLIDGKEIVLYQPITTSNNSNKIEELPLYIILARYYMIYDKFIPENPVEILKSLIDKDKKVILNNAINHHSPLRYYIHNCINDFDDKVIRNNKDIFYKDVIKLININKEYIYFDRNSAKNTYLYDILTRFYKKPSITNKNSIFFEYLNYFIENKLLFDSEIKGNQPVFNIINTVENKISKNGSILNMYISSFEEFDCDIFKYLYNKELLIIKEPTSPIISYLMNPNMLNNFDYNLSIVKLLIKNYNNISPLSIINGSKNALKTLFSLLEKSKNAIKFFTENPNSFEIIKLLTSDKRYIDKDGVQKLKNYIEDNYKDVQKQNDNIQKILLYLENV